MGAVVELISIQQIHDRFVTIYVQTQKVFDAAYP